MSGAPISFDLTNSTLTAVFIAMIYTLIRVIGYFISKKMGSDKVSLSDNHVEQLDLLTELAEKNDKYISKMHEMHNVFDQNHVPIWYVPAELLMTVRNINSEIVSLNKDIGDTMGEIKAGQTVLVDKLSDLINSQRLMTERLGDLIMKLNKMSD